MGWDALKRDRWGRREEGGRGADVGVGSFGFLAWGEGRKAWREVGLAGDFRRRAWVHVEKRCREVYMAWEL